MSTETSGSTATPLVSVVTPTYNRSGFLPGLFEALGAQQDVEFEIIVVNDGSPDDTADVLERLVGDDPRVRIVSLTNGGHAWARNHGAALARGEWIAFTDDDCLPEPTWLRNLLDTAAASGAGVVQGKTVADYNGPRRDYPWYVRTQFVGSWSGRYQTCNLLVERRRFEAVGGFDERLRHTGEDVDLGLRLVADGATATFAADGVVRHRVWPITYRQFLRWRYFRGNVVQLIVRNPDSRSIFWRPYVSYPSNLAFWAGVLASLGAVATRRYAVPVVGVAAYGAVRARRSRHKGRPLPVALVLGAADLGGIAATATSFVVNSVRHRRFLL